MCETYAKEKTAKVVMYVADNHKNTNSERNVDNSKIVLNDGGSTLSHYTLIMPLCHERV